MNAKNAKYLILDLASGHQIENGLVTEGQLIATLLHERALGSATRLEVVASKDKFLSLAKTPHASAKIVHLAAHAGGDGLGAMGHDLSWTEVAGVVARIAPPLRKGESRVLVLSCCYSKTAYRKLKKALRKHFVGVYLFRDDIVHFDVAIMTWSMFYGRKKLGRATSSIRDRINKFFGSPRLRYHRIH